MVIDPDNTDLVFRQYLIPSFIVGEGIDGVQEEALQAISQSASFDPNFDSPQSLQARSRIELARIHLIEHRSQYSSFPEKYAQASKVARTIKMHSSINSTDKSGNFQDLGFSLDTLNTFLRYAHDSLGLNYQSERDLDLIGKTPIRDLEQVLQNFVVSNFARHSLFEDYFATAEKMSHLQFHMSDDEISLYDQLQGKLVAIESIDDFANKLSETFSIDGFRIKHELQGAVDFRFSDLVDKLHEAYNLKIQVEI